MTKYVVCFSMMAMGVSYAAEDVSITYKGEQYKKVRIMEHDKAKGMATLLHSYGSKRVKLEDLDEEALKALGLTASPEEVEKWVEERKGAVLKSKQKVAQKAKQKELMAKSSIIKVWLKQKAAGGVYCGGFDTETYALPASSSSRVGGGKLGGVSTRWEKNHTVYYLEDPKGLTNKIEVGATFSVRVVKKDDRHIYKNELGHRKLVSKYQVVQYPVIRAKNKKR